ncbi:unnamed protein product [Orchesella dallaii]|uniref:Uncharacterized protein n=1 Tax=Orchesella dallaii TaxID=48710 RepID=A0ABP1RGJ6_9HEXA
METTGDPSTHDLSAELKVVKTDEKQFKLFGQKGRQTEPTSVTTTDYRDLHSFVITRLLYEFTRTLTTSDVPSLETCIDFLEERAKDVALVREITQNKGTCAHKFQTGNGKRNHNRAPCSFCQITIHGPQNYPKYGAIDQEEKKKTVKAAKLCFSSGWKTQRYRGQSNSRKHPKKAAIAHGPAEFSSQLLLPQL